MFCAKFYLKEIIDELYLEISTSNKRINFLPAYHCRRGRFSKQQELKNYHRLDAVGVKFEVFSPS